MKEKSSITLFPQVHSPAHVPSSIILLMPGLVARKRKKIGQCHFEKSLSNMRLEDLSSIRGQPCRRVRTVRAGGSGSGLS